MKGQIAMEYLLVAAFLFLMTLPLIIFYYQESISFNDDISQTQTFKALNKISTAADSVYYLGPPSKRTLTIYFPENIKNITITGREIIAQVGSGGKFNIAVETQSELNGSISIYAGLHEVKIESRGNITQIIG